MENLYSIFQKHPFVFTDSRQVIKGGIYFALKGANFDGNQFAVQAIEQGAAFAIVDDFTLSDQPQIIKVQNVLSTLLQLANYHRRQLNTPIIGITGTNGKTTSKELLSSVLKVKYNILATEGNLNNHIGVPLTLLKLKTSHQYAIIEMGANHVGEIAELCAIVEPNFGYITNVGMAHLEGFENEQNVLLTKKALYESVFSRSGINFLFEQNENLANQFPNHQFVTFSNTNPSVDTFANGSLESIFVGIEVNKLIGKTIESVKIQTQLIGLYNVPNILSALTIGAFLGLHIDEIKKGLEQYVPANNRSQIHQTSRNKLILDAYNANPSSMGAAIDNFEKILSPHKMIILGDMFELGAFENEKHIQLVEKLQNFENIKIILVGPAFNKAVQEVKPINIENYPTVDLLIESGQLAKIEQNLILVKGSRGMKMERLVELL